MYLCLGDAVANDRECRYPQGERHEVLVMSLAEDEEEARRVGLGHMEKTGWIRVNFDQIAKLDIEALNGAEPGISEAYENALEVGSHGWISKDPLE